MRGGQHQVLLLLKGMREEGHECMLLARRERPLWSAGIGAGFRVRFANVKEVWRNSKEVDMVHAHDARAHAIAAALCRRGFVVSRRTAFPVKRSFASAWKYNRAARFLAVSSFVSMELQSAGVSPDKIDVVYDGVEPALNRTEWRPSHPAVALASSDPQKGRDLVEKAARISGLRVIYSEDLPRDLREASVFVYITRSEGLGSAALLAMNMGVPVVASCIGGLREVFVDGVSGVFVKNEPDDIARAMRSVIEEPAWACSLIEQGRARIQERFTKQHLVRGTLASYERALAG